MNGKAKDAQTSQDSKPVSRPIRSYSEAEKIAALTLANAEGVAAASKKLNVPPKTIQWWRRKCDFPVVNRKTLHAPELRDRGVNLANQIGVKASALQLGVSAATVKYWLKHPVSDKSTKVYAADEKKRAIELAARIGVPAAAKDLGIPEATLYHWHIAENKVEVKSTPHYSSEIKQRAIERAAQVGPLATARELGLNEGTVGHWVHRNRKSLGITQKAKRYDAPLKASVVAAAQELDVKSVAKRFGIAERSVRTFLVQAGVATREARPLAMGDDKEFSWVKRRYPAYMHWGQLAARWLRGEKRGIATKLAALRKFIVEHLVRLGIPAEPAAFLSNSSNYASFYAEACPDSSYGRTLNNYVRKFLDWVLLQEFSLTDDAGRQVVSPLFRNPIAWKEYDGLDRHDESVHSPLPYPYIEEIRAMLAEGPNFRDWTWAQQSMGVAPDGIGQAAPDWYTVTEDQIDKDDPDCVWRRRARAESMGGDVLEMWSPVRWVALLLKTIIPPRTFQIRALDSGEADEFFFNSKPEDGMPKWRRNDHPLSQRGRTQGALRRPKTQLSATEDAEFPADVIFYCNTNKTADSSKNPAERGLAFEWLDTLDWRANPYYWVEKLRNWQMKYNPIKRMTSWRELKARHYTVKGDIELMKSLDTCFLFRVAEAKNPAHRHLPCTDEAVSLAWRHLLLAFERRLAQRGDRHRDDTPIELVDHSSRAILFPLHSLRVSLISALAIDGKVPIEILQKIVGHARFLMTIYYTKASSLHRLRELERGFERIKSNAANSIISFLRKTEYKDLIKSAVAVNEQAFASLMAVAPAARNPAGWMEMFLGLCLVGGNTSPMEDQKVGGCYNGGPNMGTRTKPRHGAVPGGARNCIRCRWFVTHAAYLHALASQFNVCSYHSSVVEAEYARTSRELDSLKLARRQAEEQGVAFAQMDQLKEVERHCESAAGKLVEAFNNVVACLRLIERCQKKLGLTPEDEPSRELVAVGGEDDVRTAMTEIDSELLQLATVCDAVEVYPELNPGKAVLRIGQILDGALHREGKAPYFLLLDESEQLRCVNLFLRKLGQANDPKNAVLGVKNVIHLIDARESLSKQLGVDIGSLLPNEADLTTRKYIPLIEEAAV
ncbi:VPA1269 family protein [Variovorax ureilyticus]|uniref:VPA1269 family protein n=1 Tax=Variovorax ureilyticus TaxID=1836198 RepID=A0ABU8VSZ9_9BURK